MNQQKSRTKSKMTHFLTADPKKLTRKPRSQDVWKVKKRMRKAQVETVHDFVEDISVGVSWSGATFKDDHLTNKNFIQTSIIGLDFDSGLTPQNAIDRLQKYNITPSCWYPSFSDDPTGNRKFRLVFFLDKSIEDASVYSTLMELFFNLYPEVDRLQDAARFFYGTNAEGIVLNPDEIPLQDLYTALSSNTIKGARLRKNKHRTKGGKDLQELASSGQKNKEWFKQLKDNKKCKMVDWDKLASRVQVFHDFMYRKKRLHYTQLEGIATNLAWMHSGKKLYRKRLTEFNKNHEGDDPYPRDGRFELARDFTHRNKKLETAMFPMNLDNPKFMAPEEDHKYKNLIEAERDQLIGVKEKSERKKLSLQDAERAFIIKYRDIIDDMDSEAIHIITAHTALGKTEAIKNSDSNSLLCFPTHDLKNEVSFRRDEPHSFITTPPVPSFDDPELAEKISSLYNLGFGGQAWKVIIDVSLNGMGPDSDKAEKYIKKRNEIFATSKAILTTHDWGIHSADKLKHVDTVVFDEDPMDTLAPIDSVNISDLVKLASNSGETLFPSRGGTNLMDVATYLMGLSDDNMTELPNEFRLDLKDRAVAYSQIKNIDSNVKNFLESDYLYKDGDVIYFINQSFLPDDKKVIILSASAHVNYYKEIYGDRVQIHDFSSIEKKGEVRQHMRKSYSRTSLKNSLDEAKRLQDGKPIITFMKYKKELKDSDKQAHFGNCSGYDHLKGQDIKVIGTPYPHMSKVLLLAKVLGITGSTEWGRKNVEYNGLEFNFSCFKDNDKLSGILFDLIHSDLVQAVGRARTLREDCRVDLYSNFPLRIATSYHV